MKPVVLTDLEAHCIAQHGVKPELVAEVAERHPDRRQSITETSHNLMHMWGGELDHTHPEFERGGETNDEVLHE